MSTLQYISFHQGCKCHGCSCLVFILITFLVLFKKTKHKNKQQKAWPRQFIEWVFWPYSYKGIEVHYSRAASQASSRHGRSRRLNAHMFKPKCQMRANWKYSEVFFSLKVCPQWCISSNNTALAQPPTKSTNLTKYLDTQALEGYFLFKLPWWSWSLGSAVFFKYWVVFGYVIFLVRHHTSFNYQRVELENYGILFLGFWSLGS